MTHGIIKSAYNLILFTLAFYSLDYKSAKAHNIETNSIACFNLNKPENASRNISSLKYANSNGRDSSPEVKLDSVYATAGEVFVSVEMNNFIQNINSFSLKIYVNAASLQFIGLFGLNGFSDGNMVAYQNGNVLSILYFEMGPGYLPDGKVFDLKFNFNATQSEPLSFLEYGNEITYGVTPVSTLYLNNGWVGRAFNILSSASENGIISPSGIIQLPENGEQTFQIQCNDGFLISDVLVDGVTIGAVTSFTFYNVTNNHTIEAVFAAKTFSLSGILLYANTNGSIRPITSSVVYLKTSDSNTTLATTITDAASGVFFFDEVTPSTYQLSASTTKSWDIMAVTIGDYALVRNFINDGWPDLSGIYYQAACVDQASGLSADDYLMIKNVVTDGNAPSMDNNGWVFETVTVIIVNDDVTDIKLKGIIFGDVNASFKGDWY